jgi:hypothetical protein
MSMTDKQIATIKALPENDFSLAKAYAQVYGVPFQSSHTLAYILLKKSEFREAVAEFLESLTNLTPLQRVKMQEFYYYIIKKDISNA